MQACWGTLPKHSSLKVLQTRPGPNNPDRGAGSTASQPLFVGSFFENFSKGVQNGQKWFWGGFRMCFWFLPDTRLFFHCCVSQVILGGSCPNLAQPGLVQVQPEFLAFAQQPPGQGSI